MNPILLRSLRWVAVGVAGLVLTFSIALACTFVYLAPALPSAQNMPQMSVPLRVYTRAGGLIAQIGEERRILVEFEDIPMIVRQAVLAAEDDRFFEHSGFAWRGIVRALVMNVATADAGQGGSTITQQAARNRSCRWTRPCAANSPRCSSPGGWSGISPRSRSSPPI